MLCTLEGWQLVPQVYLIIRPQRTVIMTDVTIVSMFIL